MYVCRIIILTLYEQDKFLAHKKSLITWRPDLTGSQNDCSSQEAKCKLYWPKKEAEMFGMFSLLSTMNHVQTQHQLKCM